VVDGILSATSFARNGQREEQERRSVLAVEKLDLSGVSITSVHNSMTIEQERFVYGNCDSAAVIW
jgi:hypothetical protein